MSGLIKSNSRSASRVINHRHRIDDNVKLTDRSESKGRFAKKILQRGVPRKKYPKLAEFIMRGVCK